MEEKRCWLQRVKTFTTLFGLEGWASGSRKVSTEVSSNLEILWTLIYLPKACAVSVNFLGREICLEDFVNRKFD